MQSKKDYIKAPSFDQKKNEPRPRNFDKIQHRFNVASSQLKYRVEKENVVTNESIPEDVLQKEMESVAQREAEKRKRIEEFQKKTKQNSKALITQNKADSKANEQKLLEEKLKKKAIEEKVKNPTVLKKAIKEHDHIVQVEQDREDHIVTFKFEHQRDPVVENIVKVASTENQTNVSKKNELIRSKMLALSNKAQ